MVILTDCMCCQSVVEQVHTGETTARVGAETATTNNY